MITRRAIVVAVVVMKAVQVHLCHHNLVQQPRLDYLLHDLTKGENFINDILSMYHVRPFNWCSQLSTSPFLCIFEGKIICVFSKGKSFGVCFKEGHLSLMLLYELSLHFQVTRRSSQCVIIVNFISRSQKILGKKQQLLIAYSLFAIIFTEWMLWRRGRWIDT